MRAQRNLSASRHGFALLAVLITAIVVGAAVLALTQLVRADVARTTGERARVQLRQLLIAGEQEARAALGGGQTPNQIKIDLKLPLALGNESTSAKVRGSIGGDAADIAVEAHCDGKSARQALRYVRAGGQWQLVSAEMK